MRYTPLFCIVCYRVETVMFCCGAAVTQMEAANDPATLLSIPEYAGAVAR